MGRRGPGHGGLDADVVPTAHGPPRHTLSCASPCQRSPVVRVKKGMFFPPPDTQVYFATSSPSYHGRRSSGVLDLGCSIAVAASSLVATTPISCETHQAVWVFPSKRSKSGHLTTLAKRFREARTKAGLSESLVLYCGRHDYGTRVLRETGNLAAVMKTMGHKDVKTAMQYQHPELEIVRQALNHNNSPEKQTVIQ